MRAPRQLLDQLGGRVELPAHDVAVAYLQRIRGGRRAVTLAERRPGGRFAAPRIVASRGRGAFAVTVAIGARGDLVVAWQRGRWVEARVRRPGRRLGPLQRLGPPSRRTLGYTPLSHEAEQCGSHGTRS